MAENSTSFMCWHAFRAGRRDAAVAARLLRSEDSARLFPYADGIAQHARIAADDATKRYRRLIAKPAERYRRLVARYESRTAPSLQRTRETFERAPEAQHPPADVVFSHRTYPWVMAALVILEFPFNLMVMQVLGENLALTALLAGGISILVPLLGHIIGKQLRLRHYFSALVIAAGGVGLLLAGAFFRETYLREAAQVSDARILYAFFAIGLVFLMVSTFASRYGEPGILENAERGESRLREAIHATFERGQLLQDLRDVEVQRAIDEHNVVLDAYWRGLQRSWNGALYPQQAGFHIEQCPQPQLWPPLALKDDAAPPTESRAAIAAVA
jgi:hypothetical protein